MRVFWDAWDLIYKTKSENQEKSDLEKSKFDDGARRLKTDFFRSRANQDELAQR